MKCKYKTSEFKKGQLLMFYRYEDKLFSWSHIIPTKQFKMIRLIIESGGESLIQAIMSDRFIKSKRTDRLKLT